MWQPEMEKKENIQPAYVDDIEEIEDVQEDPDNIRYYNPKHGGLTEMERRVEEQRTKEVKAGGYEKDPNSVNF